MNIVKILIINYMLLLILLFSCNPQLGKYHITRHTNYFSTTDCSITGKISYNDDVLPHAQIIFSGPIKGEVLSDNKGKYKITRLIPGNYTLVVNYIGFKTSKCKNIEVKINDLIEVDFILEEIEDIGLPVTSIME